MESTLWNVELSDTLSNNWCALDFKHNRAILLRTLSDRRASKAFAITLLHVAGDCVLFVPDDKLFDAFLCANLISRLSLCET